MGLIFKSKKSKPTKNPSVISFLNQKGGVGKTTMCFNTAHALNKLGHKVLCIDMDPQANLSLLCGIELGEDDYSVFNLLINSIRELKPLHTPVMANDLIHTTDSGVDILPSNQDLSGFELTVSGIKGSRPLILKKMLEKTGLAEMYDYIVIDCPPTLGLLVVNTLCASTGIMVPFRPDEFSKKGLGHLYGVLDEIEEMGVQQTPEILAHIPNLVDARRKQEQNDLEEISSELTETFGDEIKILTPFYNRSQLVRSQAQRKSVFHYQSKEYLPLQQQFNEMATVIKEWNDARH